MTLLEELKTLRDEGPKRPGEGICKNLCSPANEVEFNRLAEAWPNSSGNITYPVPDPDRDPNEAYNFTPDEEMWSPDNPYGAARLDLLDWAIEQLEKEKTS